MYQAIVDGILMGGVYALASMGLSLIFGVMKITNFAQGAMMTAGMYTVFMLWQATGISPYLFVPLAGGLMFLLGWVMQRYLMGGILDMPSHYQLLFTLGVSHIIENFLLLVFGGDYRSMEGGALRMTSRAWGLDISWAKLTAFAAAVAMCVILWLFLNKHPVGLAVRACGQDKTGAYLCGVDVKKISALSFGLGCLCTGAAGGLLTPMMSIYPAVGATLQLRCFVIAVLGGLGNIQGGFFAGLLVGVVEGMVSFYYGGSLGQLVVYLVFVLVIAIMPNGLFERANRREDGKEEVLPQKSTRFFAQRVFSHIGIPAYAVKAVFFALLLILPFMLDVYGLRVMVTVLITIILAISWSFMSERGGMFSFGHALYFGIGSYAVSYLCVAYNLSVWLGLAVGVAVGAGVASCMVYFSHRCKVKGSYFALITLAIAEICRVGVSLGGIMGGAGGLILPIDTSGRVLDGLFSTDLGCYFVILALIFVVIMLIKKLFSSTVGLKLEAVGGNEWGAVALGVNVCRYKMLAGGIGGAVCALAGGMYSIVYGYVCPSVVLGADVSVSAIIPCIIGGGGIGGAVFGSVLFVALEELCACLFTGVRGLNMLIYGVVIIVVLLYRGRAALGRAKG